ncbi:efflux RND transporter periplasmic adaptor subunit [Thermaurantimonas aggregans]|nr:efflux RND transporter periplasmic adaptor subunit [Thermaurantimonas aggregans]MCX8148857.1 efflux RND transporter periplasmic adaptor subunit [Thermaurantimonas aggregans]
MRVQLTFSLIGFFLFSSGCKNTSTEDTPTKKPIVQVDYYIAAPQMAEETFVTNAEVLPFEWVDITAEVAAKVLTIHFDEGKPVKKGDILVKLDAEEATARMLSLEAQLELAEKHFYRTEALYKQGGVSAEEYETAKSKYQQLKADLSAARAVVNKHTIRAPFDGITGVRNFSPGTFVNPQQVLVKLWQTNLLKVEIDLPERYSGYVSPGDEVEIRSQFHPDALMASVYAVEPVIDKILRSSKVRAKIANSERKLTPGTFVKATIKLKNNGNALKIPAECIVPQLGKLIVYTIDSGLVKPKPVEISQRNPVFVEVVDGLQPGDTVIASGLLQIRPGMPVVPSKPVSLQNAL